MSNLQTVDLLRLKENINILKSLPKVILLEEEAQSESFYNVKSTSTNIPIL